MPLPWCCPRYTTVLETLRLARGCDCANFAYSACPHPPPTEMLCDDLQLCYEYDTYMSANCDDKVFSRTSLACLLFVKGGTNAIRGDAVQDVNLGAWMKERWFCMCVCVTCV
jgi:hypothetical protein